MIETLELKNFKCFDRQALAFGSLTLLAGLNGSGKSSVLQALLLLRQSARSGEKRFHLNGPLVHLGMGSDVLFGQASDEVIALRMTVGGKLLEWEATYERALDVLKLQIAPVADELSQVALFGNEFNYLSADRVGPRLLYETSDEAVEVRRSVGAHGEFAVHYLARFADEPVSLGIPLHPRASSTRLVDQVEAWLSEISPGVRIHLTPNPRTDTVSAGFSFVHGADVSDEYRATNVGFGLPYSIALLVAVLAAKPGSLILLENPEAHLHPRGQAMIGELLAEVAAGGVQLLVETHSDHVLNGARVAVHTGKCPPDRVRLHFFSRASDGSSSAAVVESPLLDSRGRVDNRPDGFFDQWDKSLETLLSPQP